jgi:hypothetical protein
VCRPLRLAYSAAAEEDSRALARPATAPQLRVGFSHTQSDHAWSDVRRDMRHMFDEKTSDQSPHRSQTRRPTALTHSDDGFQEEGKKSVHGEQHRDTKMKDEVLPTNDGFDDESNTLAVTNEMLLEIEKVIQERDEQLARMQSTERALRELQNQRDQLRRELSNVNARHARGGIPREAAADDAYSDDSHGMSNISCSAISQGDGDASGIDLDSVPLDMSEPAATHAPSRNGLSRAVLGLNLVDAPHVKEAPSSMHALGEAHASQWTGHVVRAEQEGDAENAELNELAAMLGHDPVMKAKIAQLQQMLQVSSH